MKPAVETAVTGAGASTAYRSGAPVPSQPYTAVTNGAETQGRGYQNRPLTSTDPGAIQTVGGYGQPVAGARMTKEQMVGSMQAKAQPTDYVAKLAEQQQAQKTQYVPDGENKGRGVANWFKNAFKSPEDESGRRRQIQNIAAISDVLRHAANLYYTSKGATPQNIQSQYAMNQAKWQAQDALEAEREKQRQEMEMKRREQARKEYKDERTLAQGDVRNQIALGNLELAGNRDARDADMHELNKTAKQAGIDQIKHNIALGDRKQAEVERHNGVMEKQGWNKIGLEGQRVALSKARLGLDWTKFNASQNDKNVSSKTFKGKDGKTYKGKLYTTPQGATYTLSDNFLTGENVNKMYRGLTKDIKKKYNVDTITDAKEKYNVMLNAILDGAGDNAQDHKWFVYHANRLGYEYVGGMTDANYTTLMGQPRQQNNKVTFR